jgi:hypothetical protein
MRYCKLLSPLFLSFLTFSIIIATIPSCRKLKDVEMRSDDGLAQKFFQIPEDASDALRSVIADIRKQNDKHHFVNQLAGKYGLPAWGKSIANVPVRNIPNAANTRRATGDSLQVFLIPFRASDSSVSSYLACARNDEEFTYRYYKKDNLSTLYAANDTIEYLREGLLSVFGYFEKRINNKDSAYIGGIYKKKVEDVTIRFNGIPANGRSQVNDPISLIEVCYTIENSLHPFRAQNISSEVCITVGVYGSMFDMGFTSSGGYSSGGSGSSGGGGSTGSNSFPDGFQCPQSEWWCESGDYRYIDGVRYTPYAYPGQTYGLSWLWWENGAGGIPSYEHLINVLYLLNTLNPTSTQANWLANHSNEADELYQTLQDYSNLDPISTNTFPVSPPDGVLAASKITIDAALSNLITGPYNLNHFTNIITPYFPALQTNAANINPAFWYYFSFQCAIIKVEHPNWSNFRVYMKAMGDTIMELVHTGLDIAGLVPGIGEIADLANGIIYTLQGQGVNATLSFAAMIPITGTWTTLAKYGKKVITALDGSSRTLKWMKRTDGIIEFGDKNLLRKILGLAKGNPSVAHHIIPWSKASHPAVQKAAQGSDAFHLNEILNGIPLSTTVHSGNHAAYLSRIQSRLDAIPPNLNPQQTRQKIEELINDIKMAIQSSPNTHIDNLSF